MCLFVYNPSLLVDCEFREGESHFCSPLRPESLAKVGYTDV